MINHFGINIGSDTIEVAQVEKDQNSYSLVAAGMCKSPGHGLASDSDQDLLTLAEAIKKLKNEAKIKTNGVVSAVPERSIFSQIIEVPKMGEDQLAEAIPWEAENIIPQPLSEVNLDWQIIEGNENQISDKIRVLLVAAPTVLINKYLKVFKMADLEPVSLETETLAAIRCLKPVFNQGSLVIANLGGKSSELSVINNGSLYLTRSLPMAGEAITRAIVSSLNLDVQIAEEYKKNYGLSSQLEGKVAAAIEPIVASVSDEIKKAIRFCEEKEKASLKLMILTGGTSLLPGIAEYFTKAIGIEVQIADPFSLINVDEKTKQALRRNSPLFTIALGLAMKEK